MFQVYRQVVGRPLSMHHFQVPQDVRADLLLVPTVKLLNAGWAAGAIVFEVKRPGEKIGRGCNQLLDYLNSAWWLPTAGSLAVVPAFGLLFCAHKQHGPLASVMPHQHIGTAMFFGDWLTCFCGESRVLSVSAAGDLRLGRLDFGLKVGSR